MDRGKTTRWKEVEYSHGQTVGDMKENMSMTRRKVKEHSSGQTAENMKEAGKMESNTEWEFIHQQAERQNKENGKKEKDYTGFKINEIVYIPFFIKVVKLFVKVI